MIDLSNVNLLDLQTSFMKNDDTVKAMCAALTPQFNQLAEDIKRVLIYSSIDTLDETAINELAWQLSLEWYDNSLSLEYKRALVKGAIRLYKKSGTPQSVLDAVSMLYGNSSIQEWFEYDGEPFYFKINVDVSKQGASIEKIKLLEKLIDTYKNKRSWLEIINIYLTSHNKLYVCGTTNNSEEIVVLPWYIKEAKQLGSFFIATINKSLETTTIYPLEGV